MPASDLRELATYLVNCSQTSLGEFYIQRLDRASHLERNLRDVARELVGTLAMVEFADFLRNHGEEIIATNAHALPAGPRSATPKPKKEFYWWHFVTEVSISLPQFFICQSIQMHASQSKTQDGWTERLTFEDIACGKLSPGRTKALMRVLRNRHIVETQGREGDPFGQRYRLRPQAEWSLKDDRVRRKGRNPGEARMGMRFSIGADSCSVWTDGTPQESKLRGRPRLRIEHGDGTPFKTVTMGEGSAVIKVPKTSDVRDGGVISDPGSSSTGSIGDPGTATGSVSDPGSPVAKGKSTGVVSDPGSSIAVVAETEMRITRIPVMEGHILVTHPKGINPYTGRDRKEMVKKHNGQPRAETIVEDLVKKSYKAEIQFRPDWKGWPKPAPAPRMVPRAEPTREQIRLVRGPSGIWENAKLELEKVINPHSFATWFHYTKEEGVTTEGAVVVRVPSRPFQKRLRESYGAEVRAAIASVTGDAKKQVQFVVEDDIDIVPPGSVTAEQYSKTIARGGTHK